MSPKPKVLMSGCYDLLHAGHVRFFETAAEYGDLYVCIGSDENVRRLKGHDPKFNQDERLYLVRAIRHVHEARVTSGSGGGYIVLATEDDVPGGFRVKVRRRLDEPVVTGE